MFSGRIGGCDSCFVHNTLSHALSSQWTVLEIGTWSLAVAHFLGRWGIGLDGLGILSFNDTCHIGHAAVGQFNIISVEKLFEIVVRAEVFIYKLQESSSNVSRDRFIVWWVEPYYVPFSLMTFFVSVVVFILRFWDVL